MGKAKLTAVEREALLEKARKDLPKGTVCYTILRSSAASGMSRVIDVRYVKGGEILNARRYLADLLGYKLHAKLDGVTIRGTGMDMGFALVNELSSAIHGDGYALSQRWL